MLDSDILGLAAALAVSGIVMALGFFWIHLDFLVVVFRAGLTFVGVYAVVFILVKIILRTTLFEMAEQRKREEEKRKEERAAREASENSEPPSP